MIVILLGDISLVLLEDQTCSEQSQQLDSIQGFQQNYVPEAQKGIFRLSSETVDCIGVIQSNELAVVQGRKYANNLIIEQSFQKKNTINLQVKIITKNIQQHNIITNMTSYNKPMEKILPSIRAERSYFTKQYDIDNRRIMLNHEKCFDQQKWLKRLITQKFRSPFIQRSYYFPNMAEYMITEDLSKFNLTVVLLQRKIEIQEIIQILAQLTLALKNISSYKVVHANINPGCIYVVEQNSKLTAKIGDFTCAQILQDEKLTKQCGRLQYQSPQMHLQENYTFKTDVWSLGAVIYEILFKTTPQLHVSQFTTGEQMQQIQYESKLLQSVQDNFVQQPVIFQEIVFPEGKIVDQNPVLINLLRRMLAIEEINRISVDQMMKHELLSKKINQAKVREKDYQKEWMPKRKQLPRQLETQFQIKTEMFSFYFELRNQIDRLIERNGPKFIASSLGFLLLLKARQLTLQACLFAKQTICLSDQLKSQWYCIGLCRNLNNIANQLEKSERRFAESLLNSRDSQNIFEQLSGFSIFKQEQKIRIQQYVESLSDLSILNKAYTGFLKRLFEEQAEPVSFNRVLLVRFKDEQIISKFDVSMIHDLMVAIHLLKYNGSLNIKQYLLNRKYIPPKYLVKRIDFFYRQVFQKARRSVKEVYSNVRVGRQRKVHLRTVCSPKE